jgi:4-carboxymuconolactone decarboxylase
VVDDIGPLGRFPGIKASALTAEQTKAIEALVGGRGSVPAPYKLLIASPMVVEHVGTLGTDLRKRGEVTDREMEIVILVTAYHLKSAFVMAAHRRAGAKVGLSDEIMDAILSGKVPNLPDERERACYEIAIALHQENPVSQAKAEKAEKVLGLKTVSEISAFIGNYTITCYVMRFVDAKP